VFLLYHGRELIVVSNNGIYTIVAMKGNRAYTFI